MSVDHYTFRVTWSPEDGEPVADMQASGEPVPAPLAAIVTCKAEEVFGDPATAADWLNSKNAALGGVTPLSLLSTDAGAQSVLDILGRIEHGVF